MGVYLGVWIEISGFLPKMYPPKGGDMVLTDSKVKQAKFKAKDYKLSDGKGLFLLVIAILL